MLALPLDSFNVARRDVSRGPQFRNKRRIDRMNRIFRMNRMKIWNFCEKRGEHCLSKFPEPNYSVLSIAFNPASCSSCRLFSPCHSGNS